MNEFVSVAEAASIPPGHGRTVHLHGRDFAVWNVDGHFFCIDDECPHRGGPLGAGVLEDAIAYCPLHAWGFDVRTGVCEMRPDRPVKTHPARVVDGWVQICPSSAD
jgi:nitrite reductase/ring-hydroxylating ferredoxin subunit